MGQTKTHTLKEAVLIGSEKLTAVSWQEPLKWKVMKFMFRGAEGDERLSNFYSALLNLPPSTIDELSAEDVQSVFKSVSHFFVGMQDLPLGPSEET